jgi:aryl-alcohol dehydrogenase-like predicted oxidoreductase
MRTSPLGFGCSSLLGRTGRKASLAALSAAFDSGITFFDTARSYGYGEAEALLGDFLRSRRHSIILSTKFGIVPSPNHRVKRLLKPFARQLLHLAPAARQLLQRPLAAQSSPGHFTVAALHQSLEASLRALRTDYIDLLFLHEAPASVLHQHDLFAALEDLVTAGKIRRFGIASQPSIIQAALESGIRTVQSPCNLFDLSLLPKLTAYANDPNADLIAIANHPFGGPHGIARSRSLLTSLANAPSTPETLREKLLQPDTPTQSLLADAALNTITRRTPIQVVVASIMQPAHLRANLAAIEHSRFNSEELHWLRNAFTAHSTVAPTT